MAAPSCGICLAPAKWSAGPQWLPLSRPPTGHQDAGGGCAALRSPVDALPRAGTAQLLYGPAFPRPLGPSLLPNRCLYQQRHQPHHLQPHVPEVPCGLSDKGAAQGHSLPPHQQQQCSPRDPRQRCRPGVVRSPALRNCAPIPAAEAIYQHSLRATLLLVSPSGPPAVSILSACSLRGPVVIPHPLWLAGPGEGQTSLLPMTLSFRSPGASFMKQDIRVFRSGLHLDSS